MLNCRTRPRLADSVEDVFGSPSETHPSRPVRETATRLPAIAGLLVAALLLAAAVGCQSRGDVTLPDANASDTTSPDTASENTDSGAPSGSDGGDDTGSTTDSGVSDGTTDTGPDPGPESPFDLAQLFPLLDSDKGVTVVQSGNLESAVENLPSGGDPRPVQYSLLKLKEGAVYKPEDTIVLEDGEQLHAYGAIIRPQHGDAVFRMQREAKIYGGTIELRSKGGTAFDLPGGRRGFPKGPQGTRVVADPGSGATGFHIDSDNYRGGRGILAFATEGVDVPVDINILKKGPSPTFYNSHDVFVRARDYKTGIRITGTDDTNANRFAMDFTPTDRSERAVYMDSTETSTNWFEGIVRNPQKHDHLVHIASSALGEYNRPKNTFGLYSGETFDSPPMWLDEHADEDDRHDKSLNDMIDFSAAALHPSAEITADQLDVESPEILVADGSNFEDKLQEAANNDAHVRIASGSDFDISGVTIPAGVAVDARGARLTIKTRYNDDRSSGIGFEDGALLIGGRLFARMNASDGPAITIRADGTTIDEPTGPVGTMLQLKREALGVLIEAVNGGTVEGLDNRVTVFASKRAYRMRADSESAIRNNRLSLSAVNAQDYNLRMHGEGTIADNVIDANLHANDTGMEAVWIIDGPQVQDNRADGHFWDAGRYGVSPVLIERSGGDNLYANFFSLDGYNRPDPDDNANFPVNNAGSDFEMIGYDAIEREPDLLQRVAEDRLLPTSFSPFPFEGN